MDESGVVVVAFLAKFRRAAAKLGFRPLCPLVDDGGGGGLGAANGVGSLGAGVAALGGGSNPENEVNEQTFFFLYLLNHQIRQSQILGHRVQFFPQLDLDPNLCAKPNV